MDTQSQTPRFNINKSINDAKSFVKSCTSSDGLSSKLDQLADHAKTNETLWTKIAAKGIDPDLFPSKEAYEDYLNRFHKRSTKHDVLGITNAIVGVSAGVLFYKAVAPVAVGATIATVAGAVIATTVSVHFGSKLNNEHFLRGNQSDLDALLTKV